MSDETNSKKSHGKNSTSSGQNTLDLFDSVFSNTTEESEKRNSLKIPIGSTPSKIIVDGFGFYIQKSVASSGDEERDKAFALTEDVVRRYTMTSSKGVMVQVINYGATITSIKAPDKNGVEDDIILGFDDIQGYMSPDNQYFGATIGRVAGLTEEAVIEVERETLDLTKNRGAHHFHGGTRGFDKVLWDSCVVGNKVIMSHVSPDGDEGYRGTVFVQISFHLTQNNCLVINTKASTSQRTPISITNQMYFNLAGHGSGIKGMKEHCVMVNADRFLLKDFNTGIHTGEIVNVGSTYYDLRVPRPLEKIFQRVPGEGYDDVFCLTKGCNTQACTFAARLVHPNSGRYIEVITDHPSLHLYSANDLPNPDVLKAVPAKLSSQYVLHEYDEVDAEYKTSFRSIEKEWPRPESDPEEEHQFVGLSEQSSDSLKLGYENTRSGSSTKRSQNSGSGGSTSRRQSKQKKSLHFEDEVTDECLGFIEGDDNEAEEEETVVPEVEMVKEIEGKNGCSYRNHGAICFIPGEYPSALNHSNFPNPIVSPGTTYERTIIVKIGIVPQRRPPSIVKVAQDVPATSPALDSKQRAFEMPDEEFDDS